MNPIDLGDVVVLTGTFGADPTTVSAEYRHQSETSPTILDVAKVADTTATYTASFKPAQSGRYYLRMEGTGTNEAAAETNIEVRPSTTRP